MARWFYFSFITIRTQIHIIAFKAYTFHTIYCFSTFIAFSRVPNSFPVLDMHNFASLSLSKSSNALFCNHDQIGLLESQQVLISDKNLLCLFKNLISAFSCLAYQCLSDIHAVIIKVKIQLSSFTRRVFTLFLFCGKYTLTTRLIPTNYCFCFPKHLLCPMRKGVGLIFSEILQWA